MMTDVIHSYTDGLATGGIVPNLSSSGHRERRATRRQAKASSVPPHMHVSRSYGAIHQQDTESDGSSDDDRRSARWKTNMTERREREPSRHDIGRSVSYRPPKVKLSVRGAEETSDSSPAMSEPQRYQQCSDEDASDEATATERGSDRHSRLPPAKEMSERFTRPVSPDQGSMRAGTPVNNASISGNEISVEWRSYAQQQRRDMFVFPYGCVVFWGFTEESEAQVLRRMMAFGILPIKAVESDDMTFKYGSQSRIRADEIELAGEDPLEKLSISFALAQSVKLSICEARVNDTINNTKGTISSLIIACRWRA